VEPVVHATRFEVKADAIEACNLDFHFSSRLYSIGRE
jgi:hypothetical protein